VKARKSVLDVTSAYHESARRSCKTELALLGALVAARLLMTLVIHEWHVAAQNPASGHFEALDEDFMRGALHIADRLLLEEMRLCDCTTSGPFGKSWHAARGCSPPLPLFYEQPLQLVRARASGCIRTRPPFSRRL